MADIVSPPFVSSFGTNPITALHQSIALERRHTLEIMDRMAERQQRSEELKMRQQMQDKKIEEIDIRLQDLRDLRDQRKKIRMAEDAFVQQESLRFQTTVLEPINNAYSSGNFGLAYALAQGADKQYRPQVGDTPEQILQKKMIMEKVSGVDAYSKGMDKVLTSPIAKGSDFMSKETLSKNPDLAKKRFSLTDIAALAKSGPTDQAYDAAKSKFMMGGANPEVVGREIGWHFAKNYKGEIDPVRYNTPEARELENLKQISVQKGIPLPELRRIAEMEKDWRAIQLGAVTERMQEAIDEYEEIGEKNGFESDKAYVIQYVRNKFENDLEIERQVSNRMLREHNIGNLTWAEAQALRPRITEEVKRDRQENLTALADLDKQIRIADRNIANSDAEAIKAKLERGVSYGIQTVGGYTQRELGGESGAFQEALFYDAVGDIVANNIDTLKTKIKAVKAGTSTESLPDLEHRLQVAYVIRDNNLLGRGIGHKKGMSAEGVLANMVNLPLKIGARSFGRWIGVSEDISSKAVREGQKAYQQMLDISIKMGKKPDDNALMTNFLMIIQETMDPEFMRGERDKALKAHRSELEQFRATLLQQRQRLEASSNFNQPLAGFSFGVPTPIVGAGNTLQTQPQTPEL